MEKQSIVELRIALNFANRRRRESKELASKMRIFPYYNQKTRYWLNISKKLETKIEQETINLSKVKKT